MNLAIDVGNTETVLGVFGEDQVEPDAHWRISTQVPRTADEYRLLLGSLVQGAGLTLAQIESVVIGSVVPPSTEVLRTTFQAVHGPTVIVVSGEGDLPISLDVEEPRTVGADRIANTLAAKELFGRDTIVVDLGTATTFDCITADGVFVGGVISPGIQAGAEWLGRRTAKLPLVEIVPPEVVVGRRTETCIRSGLFYSAVEAIDGIVRRMLAEWDRGEVLVVATGGHAPALTPHLATVERLEPFLTLYGLHLAGRYLGAR